MQFHCFRVKEGEREGGGWGEGNGECSGKRENKGKSQGEEGKWIEEERKEGRRRDTKKQIDDFFQRKQSK